MSEKQEKFENCFRPNIEYQSNCSKLAKLKQRQKDEEMAEAFGDNSGQRSREISAKDKIIDSLLGEESVEFSQQAEMSREDKLKLLREAIFRQDEKVQQLKFKIMNEAINQYKPDGSIYFENLGIAAESFWICLSQVKRFQFKLKHEAQIDEMFWPWQIQEDVFVRFGINDIDGGGLLQTLVKQWTKNWVK